MNFAKQAIETEYGVTGLAKERRDAFAPQYDKANILGTVRDAMDQLLEEGDYTRPNKAIKSRINALTAAYWLVVVAIFL